MIKLLTEPRFAMWEVVVIGTVSTFIDRWLF